MPYQEKLNFLQIDDLAKKIKVLTGYLVVKIEKDKDVTYIKNKVEEEVSRNNSKLSTQQKNNNNPLLQKIQKANLPENVRSYIEKEFKNMGYDNEKAVT